MADKRWILFLLPAAMIALLAGCGGGNTFDVKNPPPPPPAKVTIAFQPPPATSIPINTTTSLTAVVSNDSSNAGVDWSVTCSNTGNCGKLSSPHTASGAAVTYTPPSALLGNAMTVNVVAFATADQSQNALAPIAVTAFGSALGGTYVLQAQGSDSSFGPYQFAGIIVLDGNGGIVNGEQTVNFNDPNLGLAVSKSDPITGGSYFLGADGRGTITIKTDDQDVGIGGTETFGFVFLSASQALISEVAPSSNASAPPAVSGTMDLQDPKFQTQPPPSLASGGYALVVSGTDPTGTVPQAFGGILDLDSSNNVVSASSVMDEIVALNGAGVAPVVGSAKPSGAVSNAPGPFGGVITLTLTVPFPNNPAQFTFTGYIVDDAHIKLIESDNTSGTGFGLTAGLAIAQQAPPGSFSSFSGTYAFGVGGVDLSSFAPATLTSAGVFNADAGLGYMDTFLQAYSNPITGAVGAQISASFDGTTAVDANGIGRVRSPFTTFDSHPRPGFAPIFIFYLTGNGNCPSTQSCPALILANGGNNYPFLGTGIAYPQSTSLTFSGNYGFNFAQQNGGGENDGIGQISADAGATPPLSGVVDSTIGGVSQGISGAFNSTGCSSIDTVTGCFPGTLQNIDSAGNGTDAFLFSPFPSDFYMIDQDHGFFVETDLLDPNNPSGVVSLGYYACQNPITGPPTCSAAQQVHTSREQLRKK